MTEEATVPEQQPLPEKWSRPEHEQRIERLEEENARLRQLIDRYRRPMPDGGYNWRERAHTAHVRACDAEAENARLREECPVCESCGHVQGDPNWCQKCGHRTSNPPWREALEREGRAHAISELRDAATDEGPQSAYWLAADYLERK
jgi:hypothetical protein